MDFEKSKAIFNYYTKEFPPLFLSYIYYKFFKSIKPLKFQEESYKYFYRWYNYTWTNERSIEIPIVCKFIKKYKDNEILEVGNVLSHYFKWDHDVVDKYEKAEGVINQDIVDFHPSKKYGIIVSISTLEHVGWDETPKDPKKIFPAIKNLKNCLMPRGKLIITIPLGHNPYLDELLKTEKLKFTENYYFKRISKGNEWIDLGSNYCKAKYDHPYPSANVLFLGIYQKE